uniref:Uncharacterized protein n=1 Tax=Romanomermis culicivorax TaxID=13658 RepID=A0A915HWW1_ROMCU
MNNIASGGQNEAWARVLQVTFTTLSIRNITCVGGQPDYSAKRPRFNQTFMKKVSKSGVSYDVNMLLNSDF